LSQFRALLSRFVPLDPTCQQKLFGVNAPTTPLLPSSHSIGHPPWTENLKTFSFSSAPVVFFLRVILQFYPPPALQFLACSNGLDFDLPSFPCRKMRSDLSVSVEHTQFPKGPFFSLLFDLFTIPFFRRSPSRALPSPLPAGQRNPNPSAKANASVIKSLFPSHIFPLLHPNLYFLTLSNCPSQKRQVSKRRTPSLSPS